MANFVDTFTPEGNMRSYGSWKNAVKTNINQARDYERIQTLPYLTQCNV